MNDFSLNWVDLIIVLVVLYYSFEAIRHGFLVMSADFLSFLSSLVLSLRFYKYVSVFLESNFGLGGSISKAVGFLATALLAEAVLSYVFAYLISKINSKFFKTRLSKLLAIIPAVGEALIIVSIIATLIIALPIKPNVKKDIIDSKVAGILLEKTTRLESSLNEIFGEAIEQGLTYLTIRPGSTETIPLTSEVQELTVDEASERALFNLVNEERKKAGVHELLWRDDVLPSARAHARDMWERKYFSHVSPEGKDVGDRLAESNIRFTVAGENLALAPSVSTAHAGLMNSEGHRANILEASFKRIGIGVIDNGIYGKMFVQVFTD